MNNYFSAQAATHQEEPQEQRVHKAGLEQIEELKVTDLGAIKEVSHSNELLMNGEAESAQS